jgi:hypothetical protein
MLPRLSERMENLNQRSGRSCVCSRFGSRGSAVPQLQLTVLCYGLRATTSGFCRAESYFNPGPLAWRREDYSLLVVRLLGFGPFRDRRNFSLLRWIPEERASSGSSVACLSMASPRLPSGTSIGTSSCLRRVLLLGRAKRSLCICPPVRAGGAPHHV